MAREWKVALCILSAVAGIGKSAFAHGHDSETLQPVSRIVDRVDDAKLVLLRGNTRPETRLGTDLGSVDPQLLMRRMLLMLKRSPEQEAALAEFNAHQLDPSSLEFHHWLTPEQFGALYGPSDTDIETVTAWLQNHGFTIDNVSQGRVFIEFSGTASLVQRAFHSEIHRYKVRGEEHIANSSDPSIPEALAPVVAGIFSLNNFYAKPLHHEWGIFGRDDKTGKWTPENGDIVTRPFIDAQVSGSPVELVSPYDFATMYNVLPLWNGGIDGSGQTIAIAGRSDIDLTDVARFRRAFGLPAKAPTVVVNGSHPGILSPDDKVENTLDVEWSGAVAKGATIKFVTTASTASSDGAFSSAAYIIDNNLATIMSFSYGACELAFGTAGNAAINGLWQQGATEGITIFVASGNHGSTGCDGGTQSSDIPINGASSTPYNVAVGGTDLNWMNSSTGYWNTSNATNGSSAKGYIPEVPWAGRASGVSACTAPGGTTAATCTGGYAKPSWQTGRGVPADGKRDVPDLSLFASGGTLNSAYPICNSDEACTYNNANDVLVNSVGGTSVAAPAMAGIMALVNQKTGSAQGNANAAFYALAARDARSNCNSNFAGNGSACIFHDIIHNAFPCTAGSQNCTVGHAGDSLGTSDGYKSTVGYDLATGLGSINANNLVNNWNLVVPAVAKKPTATTGAASSITGTTATVAGSVNPNGAATHFVFAYGTSSTLVGASKTASVNAGSGSLAVGVSVHLSGLKPVTKYYFQLQATNSAGTTKGAIHSFTTLKVAKPTVTTGAASSIAATTATIAGSVTPNGADTHMVFAYGTSSTLASAKTTTSVDIGAGTSAVGVSVHLTALTAGTKYYFQVRATNSAGTTNGAIKSFTTTSTAKKPTATTGAASSITAATATIAGSVNPNGADTHRVFAYGTSSTLAGATKTASVDVGSGTSAVAVSANLTGLTAGTKYYFQVQATNSAGTTNGAINSFTTTAAGWSGQVKCVKTVSGPSYSNNDTQTWTVAPGIVQQPTGQTIYPTQWKSTGSGGTATQTWVINASGTGKLTVFTNSAGLNFARFNSEIVVPDGYQSTPPPNYADYEYQWPAFGNSNANATHVQGSNSLTSHACDSPVEPGAASCTVTCSWDFDKK